MNSDKLELFDGCIEIEPDTSFETISIITPSSKGVILFTDANDTAVQLLIAANIRRTVRAKLFTEEPQQTKRRTDLTAIVRKIYFHKCWGEFETGLWHYRIAKQIYPLNYAEQIAFANAVYLKIDPSANWPEFAITESPASNGKSVIFGPFDSRKSYGIYSEAIIEAFSLCRRSQCIDNPQKAMSCPYLQMGLCDGVCIGKISRGEYLERIKKAVDAAGEPALILEALNAKMLALSGQMKFELAQSVKDKLEEFSKRLNSFYWIKELSKLAVLHIDLSDKIKIKGRKTKIQMFAAFLITARGISQLEKFDIDGVDKIVETIRSVVNLPRQTRNTQDLREPLSLFSYYLYKSNRPGIWIGCDGQIDTSKIKSKITQMTQIS